MGILCWDCEGDASVSVKSSENDDEFYLCKVCYLERFDDDDWDFTPNEPSNETSEDAAAPEPGPSESNESEYTSEDNEEKEEKKGLFDGLFR